MSTSALTQSPFSPAKDANFSALSNPQTATTLSLVVRFSLTKSLKHTNFTATSSKHDVSCLQIMSYNMTFLPYNTPQHAVSSFKTRRSTTFSTCHLQYAFNMLFLKATCLVNILSFLQNVLNMIFCRWQHVQNMSFLS